MPKYNLYYRLDDINSETLKEVNEIKEFSNYEQSNEFIENLANEAYKKLFDVYIQSIMKYEKINRDEAEKMYREKSYQFISFDTEEIPYDDVVKITVKYEAGHSYDCIYGKTNLYCPHCGEQNVWVEHGEGDYYVGSDYHCGNCGSAFNLPILRENKDTSWQDKQVFDLIKTR